MHIADAVYNNSMDFNLKKAKIDHFLSTILGAFSASEKSSFKYNQVVLSFTCREIHWMLIRNKRDFSLWLAPKANKNTTIAIFDSDSIHVANGISLSLIDMVWEGLEVFWRHVEEEFPALVNRIEPLIKGI